MMDLEKIEAVREMIVEEIGSLTPEACRELLLMLVDEIAGIRA